MSASRRSRLAGWIWLSTKGYAGRIRPASAIAAIMRSGRMPLASGESVNDTCESLGVLRMTSLTHPDAENTDFYRLSDGRLDGKGAREYQHDLSRGDLSRPACSHVKQVAKQAGDRGIPAACGIFP